jgi:hypothetical protein
VERVELGEAALGVNYKVRNKKKGHFHILKVINTQFFEEFSRLFIETQFRLMIPPNVPIIDL